MTEETQATIPSTASIGRGAMWLIEGLDYFSRDALAWIGMTILVSTPILTVGWYLLSLIAKNRQVQLLTPKVRKPLEEKGRLPSQFKNP